MANRIDKSAFVGIVHIDTSRTMIVTQLTHYITYVENKYMASIEVVEDEEIEAEINAMLTYFTYFWFTKDQMSINTQIGEVSQKAEFSDKGYNTDKAVRAYNLAVDIYNKYANDTLDYINSYGI